MDEIIKHLNEKFKNKKNTVAEKVKRVAATALVAGTILTGAGLTGCEMDDAKDQEKQIYFQVEQKLKDYEKVDDNFQLDSISVLKNNISEYNLSCADIDDSSEDLFPKTYVSYELSEEQFNTIYEFAKENQEDNGIAIYEDSEIISINFDVTAIKNKNYKSIFEFIFNIMNATENPMVVNYDDLETEMN